MKKTLLALLLAALLTCTFALAEENAVPDGYVGVWGKDRITLVIEQTDDGLGATVTWPGSAWELAQWEYTGLTYDEVSDALSTTETGVKTLLVFGEDGEIASSEVEYDDGAALFKLNDDGTLTWTDFKQTPGENEIVLLDADMPLEAETGEDALFAAAQPVTDSPEWVKSLPQAQDEAVRQLFIVAGIGMDKTTATVSMHERDEQGDWHQILSTPGFVGKNGLCPDEEHVEGCGQTPIGVYGFNRAFGIAADPGCALEYTQVDDDDYWSGDLNEHYNEMVRLSDYPELDMENSEHIVDYEFQYQYCLNISFNADGTPGRGSAIFLHCLGPVKPWTGGCVAIPEYLMRQVMQTVREDCVVVIDTCDNLGVTF